MSRAIANTTLYAAVSSGLSKVVAGRSFSAAAGAVASGRQRERTGAAALMRGEDKTLKIEVGDAAISWVPDPVTGYYRPANRGDEVDVAELRNIHLNRKH